MREGCMLERKGHRETSAVGTMVTSDVTWFAVSSNDLCAAPKPEWRWPKLNPVDCWCSPIAMETDVAAKVACIRNVVHVVETKTWCCDVHNFRKGGNSVSGENGKSHCSWTSFPIKVVPTSLCTMRCRKPCLWVTRTKLTSPLLSSSNVVVEGRSVWLDVDCFGFVPYKVEAQNYY